MAGCLAPEKARINRVSQRPPKGARRGIGKIVLPTHGRRYLGRGCATTRAPTALLTQGKEKATGVWWPKSSVEKNHRVHCCKARLMIQQQHRNRVFDRRQEHAQGASFRVSAVIQRGR